MEIKAGVARPINSAMMAMTTINSISENAYCDRALIKTGISWY
jgi:hypothetical protein